MAKCIVLKQAERERDAYTICMFYRLEMGGEIFKAWGSNKAYFTEPGRFNTGINNKACCCRLLFI